MELSFYINSILLSLTISYGFAFGIKNWVISLISLLSGSMSQSTLGRFLDGIFLTAVIYFFTIGKPFIKSLELLY